MANVRHLEIVRAPSGGWNDWRRKNTRVLPDLAGADLCGADLAGANLAKADLSGARLEGAGLRGANLTRARFFGAQLAGADLNRATLVKANLSQADLAGVNLNSADLSQAFLIKANLSGASLVEARLEGANLGQASLFRANLTRAALRKASFFKADLTEADLSETDLDGANLQEAVLERTNLRAANLSNANLCFATLLRTNLEKAVIDNCSVCGISLWDVDLKDARQQDLDIMPPQQPVLAVDNLQTAQLVGMLLHQQKSRNDVFSVSLNTVLVMGRFPPERKPVLEAIKDALRRCDYSPLVLDFLVPGPRDMNETVKTLGRMSRFIIADLTDDRRVAQTLDSVVHYLPSVPIQPIVREGGSQAAESRHYFKYHWVLPVCRFRDTDDLVVRIDRSVIAPVEKKALEVRMK
ncbi:MAG: pentapeptide repeat-containing protein [Candidatus Aminicenantes bacterium]|nr:pentapeptide repeat-containing protein [Candidatus Aminicenantes bacterium]